ncbi:MAG: aminoglycoside phosphotransferase family protein [Gemmatimonadaceae bacterium]
MRATRIRAATSCLMHEVEIEAASEKRHFFLRRFTDEAWVKREPDIALRESASLEHARRAGLPTPMLRAVDSTGERCGVPATLVTKVAGQVVLSPTNPDTWVTGLARAAALVHRVEASGFRWKYRRYNEGEPLTVPAWSQNPRAWQKAIDVVNGPPPSFSECFVHRDYHPNNVLWDGDRVSGIVDWVNGCRGPAGIDVAWCRHNLANLHGVAMADEFLEEYINTAGSNFEYDPYWDLMSVVELLPGPPSMYDAWRIAGYPSISNALMRERVDAYVGSVVARL